jgi:hypothetical protein
MQITTIFQDYVYIIPKLYVRFQLNRNYQSDPVTHSGIYVNCISMTKILYNLVEKLLLFTIPKKVTI